MKKTLSLLVMLCMLVSVIAPTLVFAEPSSATHTFWLTHYNDGKVEGSGVIFTKEDTAGGWWLHVAFAPIEGAENAYEIVDISNGVGDGMATPVEVPAGGFVWAANYGNDYPWIYDDPNAIDYTSTNCTNAITRAFAWSIGDRFVIEGVDFETIPTTTPDVMWYDEAYVCTATIAPYGESSDANHQVTVNVNDIPTLTDGIKYVNGDWDFIDTSDICLVQNPDCEKKGMDVTFEYDLGEVKTVDSMTLYLYHCAGVMIGYPEGDVRLEISTDGESFEPLGTFKIAPVTLSYGINGTVATTCSFEPAEVRCIRATVTAGSNRDVLGDAPTDGKFFWEFISVVEIEVGKASVPDVPNAKDNLAAGKNYTAAGLYPDSYMPTYPDEGGVTLTDGVSLPSILDFSDPAWVGFNAQSYEYDAYEGAVVVIDLGTAQTVNKGVVHAYKQTDVGITVPYGVMFSVSDDGVNYTELGYAEIEPDYVAEGVYDIVCDFHTEAEGRYIKVNLFLGGWGFVSEIGLYHETAKTPDKTVNLALGKKVNYAKVNGENDSYNADLTDGIASDVISYDGDWFAFYYNLYMTEEENIWLGANSSYGIAAPTIDLGETCSLDSMRINLFLGNESGVAAPYAVFAEVSDDGLTYSQVGIMPFDLPPVGDTTVGWVEFDLLEGIDARYVRFHILHELNWVFVNEIEIYGAAGESVDDPAKDFVYVIRGGEVTITEYKGNGGNVTIPSEIEGCPVTAIGEWAFVEHTAMTGVVLPLGIKTIGEGAFWGCTALASVNIPDSVTVIDDGAFINCPSLTSVAIPDSVTDVGSWAFAGCTALTDIYCEASEQPAAWDVEWVGIETNATVHWGVELEPDVLYGDVNGDGAINGLDATRLLNYLANYDYANGTSAVEVSEGADCNGDGIIDGRDSIRLLQYLANYDPITGESDITLGK